MLPIRTNGEWDAHAVIFATPDAPPPTMIWKEYPTDIRQSRPRIHFFRTFAARRWVSPFPDRQFEELPAGVIVAASARQIVDEMQGEAVAGRGAFR